MYLCGADRVRAGLLVAGLAAGVLAGPRNCAGLGAPVGAQAGAGVADLDAGVLVGAAQRLTARPAAGDTLNQARHVLTLLVPTVALAINQSINVSINLSINL